MTTPHCTVIVLNWNGRDFLRSCLGSLRQQTYRNFDILLLDNASQDGSVDYVNRHFPEVQVLSMTENFGFCRPNNLGLEQAMRHGSEFALLLNNDTTVAPDCLEQMMAAAGSDSKVAVVCPKIFFADAPNTLWYAGADFSLWTSRSRFAGWRQKDEGQCDERRPITQATGCAMLVRISSVREIGLLDERLWAYVEDLDWSIRFRREGYELRYEPSARIWHQDGGTTVAGGSQFRRQYLTTRNLLLLCREHVRWWQLPTFLAGFLLFHVAYYSGLRLLRGDFRALRAIGRAIADSLHPAPAVPDAQFLELGASTNS